MMKKTLMSVAAAAAIVTGASALTTTPAEAGKFSIHIGGYGHGFHNFYHGGCYTKWKRVRVKIWTYHGPRWRWRYRPVRICY